MMIRAALWYAAFGWPVFPCHTPRFNGDNLIGCTCGDASCKSVGKHPRIPNGVKGATTNHLQIRRWWLQWPNANIGIATGSVGCGAVVIDVDADKGGFASLKRLGTLPAAPEAFTGGGGAHIFVKAFDVGNRATVMPGLDVRGDGGYVVAAPSLHRSGRRYSWQAGCWPHRVPLPVASAELVALLKAPKHAPASTTTRTATHVAPGSALERAIRYARQIEPAIEGSGGDAWTFSVAARVVRGFDLTDAEGLVALREWNATCSPPWKEHDLLKKIRNARRFGGEPVGGRLRRAS